jgi:hypothetical protein
VFELIGMITVVIVVLIVIVAGIYYRNDKYAFVFAFYGFAIIVARDQGLKNNLNKIKKTTNRKVFFDVPNVRAFR